MRLFIWVSVTLAVLLTRMLVGIQATTLRSTIANNYAAATPYAALYSTAPGAAAGTELTGGSPAYARIATAWTTATGTAGVVSTGPHTFNVASGSTVAGAGLHSAVTAGNYLDGGSLTSQGFSSQGTYALTLSYTQT